MRARAAARARTAAWRRRHRAHSRAQEVHTRHQPAATPAGTSSAPFSARFANAGKAPSYARLGPCYVRPAGPAQGPLFHRLPPPPPPRRISHAPVIDDEHPSCWRPIRAELQRAVSESTWHQWLEPLSARTLRDDQLVVEAPDAIRPWVEQRFGRLLHACTAAVLGPGVDVRLAAPGSTTSERADERHAVGT